MKIKVIKRGAVSFFGRDGVLQECPWMSAVSATVMCSNECPFCEISDMQVVLHCTGKALVFERVVEKQS